MIPLSNDVNTFIETVFPDGNIEVDIYARKSRAAKNKKKLHIQKAIDRFDSPASILHQIEQCKKFAEERGWKVSGVFEDVKSGASAKRNGLRSLRQRVDSGTTRIVLVHRLDRIARGSLYGSIFHDWWRRPKPVLIFPISTPQMDFSSMFKFMQHIISGVAELDVNVFVERVFEITLERAKSARLCGGVPPYGYKVTEEGIYYVDEEKRAEIEFSFLAIKEGLGYKTVIRQIFEQFGRRITKSSLVSRLRQYKYAGIFIFNRKGSPRRSEGRILDKIYDQITVDDGVPAIISRELFFEVQSILDQRSGQGGNGKNRDRHPLNDKVLCKICSRQLRGCHKSKSGRSKTPYDYYECSQHRAQFDKCPCKPLGSVIQELCYEALDKAMQSPIFKQALLDGITEMQNGYDKKIAKLEKDISLLENGINQAIAELLANPALRDELTKSIEVKRRLITSKAEEVSTLQKSKENLTALTTNTHLPPCRMLSYETRLVLIDNFIQKIIVDNDNIEIHFS